MSGSAHDVREMEMIREPKVGILVLNWNNWGDTIMCLESLRNLSFRNYQIILIDNGSGNESVKRIRHWLNDKWHSALSSPALPPEAKSTNRGGDRFREARYKGFRTLASGDGGTVIILTGENLGFAGGNNIGIDYALDNGCEYVWILNSDTIVDSEALQELVEPAASDEKIGMVGSRLLDKLPGPGESGRPGNSGGRRAEIEVKRLSGASLLARAACIEEIGKIDEDFFLYWEEVDWCLRARNSGWKLLLNPRSIVFHEWGASTHSKRIVRRFLGREITRVSWDGFLIPGYYEARNGVHFVRKNFASWLAPYVFLRTLHLLAQILLYDDHKTGRWKIILKGTWDGLQGRRGMTVDPSRPV